MAPDFSNIKTKVNNRFKDISDVIKTKTQGLKGSGDGEGGGGGFSKVTSTVSSSMHKITGKISKKKTGSMSAPSTSTSSGESRLRRIANKLFGRGGSKKNARNQSAVLPPTSSSAGRPSFGVKDRDDDDHVEIVSSIHEAESVKSLPDFLDGDHTHNPDEETSVTYKSVIQD